MLALKGQLSIEVLIIAALSLALLSVSIASLSMLVQGAAQKFEQRDAHSSLEKISLAAESVCLMGEGNRRLVEIPIENFTLAYENNSLFLYYKNAHASAKAPCEIALGEAEAGEAAFFEKTLYVFYANGKAAIKGAN